MPIPRIYTPQHLASGQSMAISGQSAHHVTHVLRLHTGTTLHVFDGKGAEHIAVLKQIKRTEIILETGKQIESIPESPLQVTLLQGITRKDRMDLILQKAVELGVQRIQPLWMQRSQARIKSERLEKRVRHWQGIIISACEQSGRAILPQLSLPEDFTGWISASSNDCLRIMLQPGSQYRLRDLNTPDGDISLLAGPEGGLNSDEQTLARSCGFTAVQLGPRILRTETAAITALAGMQALWGDF